MITSTFRIPLSHRSARGLAGAAVVGVALLLAIALVAPARSSAGIKQGRYVGNSTAPADEPVSFKVKKTKGKNGKQKTKVKNFRMRNVSMDCELRDPENFPWEPEIFGPFPTEVVTTVPFGGSKVKKRKKTNQKAFSTRKQSNPNPDAGLVGKARGRFTGSSARGSFEARFFDHFLDCRQGTQGWEASRVGK